MDRNQVLESIDGETAEILDLAHWMSAHPELSLEERETSESYVAYLTARDFNVSRGTAEMDTDFVAEYGLPSAP
ncbi:MAG: hypothetical protein IID05_12270, partial [Gemmatimonadetes bacterium]|nr:hypothetical protein [Gemmatimonadota bacterium]